MLILNCVFAAYAAALRARGRKPNRFPPSCQSPTFPLGRASRARCVTSKFSPPTCPKQQEGQLPPHEALPSPFCRGAHCAPALLGWHPFCLPCPTNRAAGRKRDLLLRAQRALKEGVVIRKKRGNLGSPSSCVPAAHSRIVLRARTTRPYDGLNGASPWSATRPSCCFWQTGGGNFGVTHLCARSAP